MVKTPKVLMIVENCPAPQDHRVWPEAIVLRDVGYSVSIISPKGETDQRESYVCIDSIHIYRYNLPLIEKKYIGHVVEYGVALFMTFWLSVKVLFERGFDVIHVANPPDFFFLIGLFYRFLGKKFIFDQHDLSPEMFRIIFKKRANLLYKVLRFLEMCSYGVATLIIVTNESQKRFAIERGHCRPDRVFVVRNGPKAAKSRVAAPDPQLKAGRPYLLGYVGIMGVQDGVENALYALHELIYKRGRRDISLVLLGNGSSLHTLRTLASELLLNEFTTFTGLVPYTEVVRYLSAVDIGLVPDPQNDLNEHSTMMKTMDYMAQGKPIVAFDLKETRFSAQQAALYAMSNLIEDFADKIEMLLADEQLRLKMGQFGRRRIEEELSWERTSKNLVYAYEILFPDGEKPLDLHTHKAVPS